MTEAMSHREIEDVLSSVKRLVSQDNQQRPLAAPRPEKLVLTSALRVLPENDPDPESESDSGADARPESSDAPDGNIPDKADGASAALIEDTSKAPAPEAETPAPEAAPAPETALPPSLIRRIAQAGSGPDVAPGLPFSGLDAHETDPRTAAPSPKPCQPDPLVLEDAALEATLARLEAALSGKPAPQTATAAVQESTPPASSAPPRNEDDQIIDEGTLYQLVAHIVRQELQGELGEKITRNIRKLVRQEVARELQLRRD